MSTQMEWQKISGEVKYDNPWINVTEDQVINPAGKPAIYGKVHFKNLAIGIVPIDANGCIYFVRQFRYVLNEYSLEIPEDAITIAAIFKVKLMLLSKNNICVNQPIS